MSSGDVAGIITNYSSSRTETRLKLAIDLDTRRFWIKETGEAFQGNPAAGTGQLFTLNGTSPIMFGAVAADSSLVTIVAPDDHIDTPPAGFVPH